MGYYRDTEDLNGLAGWLIFVGIGVTLTPFKILTGLLPFWNIFREGGNWSLIASQESTYYNPLLATLIASECIINVIYVLVAFYSIYLFFTKHYLFPRVFIGFALARAVIFFIDAWGMSIASPDTPMIDKGDFKSIGSLAGLVIIWVPYMLLSERVKQTFINGRKDETFAPEAEAI